MPKPPVDPDSFDKINFVIDAWATGCDAPWYIYIETLKPALLKAFITLITFGWDDVLRGYFRPRGLYRRRSSKRKGKWARRVPRWPEFGDAMGKRLPGAYEVKGVTWSGLGKTLWRIDGAMEMIRFYWLVAAIAEDFAFDWTSLLYESYWCLPDAGGRFSFQTIGWGLITSNHWKLAGFGTQDYLQYPPGWGFLSGTTGPSPAVVTAALRVKRFSDVNVPSSIRVVVRNTSTSQVYADSGTNDQLINGEGAAVATGTVPPGTTFEIRAWMEGAAYCYFGEGVVMGFEVKQ